MKNSSGSNPSLVTSSSTTDHTDSTGTSQPLELSSSASSSSSSSSLNNEMMPALSDLPIQAHPFTVPPLSPSSSNKRGHGSTLHHSIAHNPQQQQYQLQHPHHDNPYLDLTHLSPRSTLHRSSDSQNVSFPFAPLRLSSTPRNETSPHPLFTPSANTNIANQIRYAISPRSTSPSNLKRGLLSPNTQNSSPNANIDVSSRKSKEKFTGPESFLASLQHDTTSTSITNNSVKRVTFNGRKSAFFNSVKSVLRKNSVTGMPVINTRHLSQQTQKSLIKDQASSSVPVRRDSLQMSPAMTKLADADSALPPPDLKATEQLHVNEESNAPCVAVLSCPTTNETCNFIAGVNKGLFSQSLDWNGMEQNRNALSSSQLNFQTSLSNLDPNAYSNNEGNVDDKYIEKWSESDDPLSPASFQEVMPGIYLGSAKSALNIDRLIQHRITHILTVMNRPLNVLARPGDAADADILSFNGRAALANHATQDLSHQSAPSDHPLFSATMHAITFHFCYLLDIPEADLLSALEDCLPFMEKAHQEERGNILVHCQAGISRSASVVIAYISRYHQLSVKHAYELTSLARPYINPNEGFVSQLELFQRNEKRRANTAKRAWAYAMELCLPWINKFKSSREALYAKRKNGFHLQCIPNTAILKEHLYAQDHC